MQKDFYWGNDLVWAAREGKAELLMELLESGRPVDGDDQGHPSPLMHAVASGNLACAEILIAHNANLSYTTDDGGTAVLYAAAKGEHVLLQKLLDLKGTSPNDMTADGTTSLIWAIKKKSFKAMELLVSKGARLSSGGRQTLLGNAFDSGIEYAEYLLEHGANPNEETSWGEPILLIETKKGRTSSVELLMRYKVNVNQSDIWGQTALNLAAELNNTDLLNLLLKYGANPNGIGQTPSPLLSAARAGAEKAGRLLLSFGADAENRGGSDILAAAFSNGNDNFANMMLEWAASNEGAMLADEMGNGKEREKRRI